jgi:hypothetical protein
MQIREKQMEAFADSMLQQFESQMAAHLRSRFPKKLAGTNDGQLQARVHQGIDQAESYGVTAKYDIRRYLEYTVEYGPDFDTFTPWAGPILKAKGVSGNKKMNNLDDYSTFELRG